MMNFMKSACLFFFLIGLSLPVLADDEKPERASRSGDESAAAGTMRTKDDDTEEAGLLLPAVQKVRSAAAKSEGVEPDEIDAANTARSKPGIEHEDIGAPRAQRAHKPGSGMSGQSRSRGGAVLESGMAARKRHSVQQMIVKLKPRATLVATKAGGSTSPADKVAAPTQPPPRYEIADCGTNASPMICCHHEAGDGSTCNMFQMLCENAGGTAQGDGTDATCSDWP